LPVSISVFATAALASFQALGISAALPDISADLGNVALLPWAITAFLLTSSLATAVAGPFIDAVGVSRTFRIAVTVFTTIGFASAFAPTMEVLVVFRALQGVGAGLILSTGTSAISLVYPSHLVGRAYAANATVWGVMGVAGPAIAAFILTFFTWQWIFYINLPLGIIALIAGWKVLPGPFGESTGRFDLFGAVLLSLLTFATLLAVDALNVMSLAWLAVAGLAVALYARHARRSPSPVVRLEHLVVQPYRGLAVSTGLMLVSAFAMSSYIPLYVRAGLGESPGVTAWSVLPLTVGWTIGAIISSRLADRHSESWIILLGFMVSTPALAVTWYLVPSEANLYATFALFFITGVGVGLATNAALTLLRSVTESANVGRVVSAHLFARNQGFTFGAAIGGAVLFFVVTMLLGDVELVSELISNGDAPPPAGAAEAVQSGFAASIAVGVVLSVLGWLGAVGMRRSLTEARLAKRGT
jgi:MFS family permease